MSEAAAGADRADLRTRLTRVLFGQSFLSGVVRSFLTLAAGEWIARLIGVAIQIWLARELTPGPYGVITFGLALVGWFGLVVDSGTEQLNVREISRHPARFRELADRVLGLRIALSIAAGIVLAVVTYEFSNSADAREVLPRFALVLPALAINLRWMVLGIGKARAVAYGNIASRIVFLAAIVLLVTEPSNDVRVPIIEALSEATYAVVIIVLAAKAYGYVRPRIDLAAWRATLTEGFPLLVYGACRATILTADVVLIALILGHGQVGLYGAALYPERSATENSPSAPRKKLTGFSAAPLAVLAWTLPLAGLSVPYGSVLVARNRQDLLMHNNIIGAAFNVVACLLAVEFIGITGAAAVRVATYGIMLFLNHNACVKRGLAPSLSAVFAGRLPRVAPGRGRA